MTADEITEDDRSVDKMPVDYVSTDKTPVNEISVDTIEHHVVDTYVEKQLS
jgi:hypothetical protein